MSVDLQSNRRLYELEGRLEARKSQLQDLAMMGAVITSIHEIDRVLSVVIDMAIRLVQGEVGIIMLEKNGQLSYQAAWGVTEEFVKSLMYEDELDLATYCFNARETVILSELGLKNEQGIQVESIIAAPIKTSSQCYGVAVIINRADGGSFGDEEKEILEMLFNFVAVAIDNSLLMKDKLKQQKIEQEMAIARQVQSTILPQTIDDIKGAEIGAVYFPAREVGGDFYDVINVDESNCLVVIGDVSNKGVPAALVMSAAAGIIKSTIADNPHIEMSTLAESVNNILSQHIIKDREMFVTLFFCRFDFKTKRVTYCNAGHLPGLFWDSQENRIVELAEGGTIIGQFEGISFKTGERAFQSGDRLFLFTDGLTEAEDNNGLLFGRERVEQVFSSEMGLMPKEFCLKVKEWVDRFTEGAAEDSHDDFTILQVRVK